MVLDLKIGFRENHQFGMSKSGVYNNHLIDDIPYPNNGPKVTNIQYADDTLIFLNPSEEHVINLKWILCCF